MIFNDLNEKESQVERRLKRTRQHWVSIGARYLRARDKGISQRQFADENKIPRATLQGALTRFKDDIIAAYTAEKGVNKNRSKWINYGIDYAFAREKGESLSSFAKRNDLTRSTFQAALKRYNLEIQYEYERRSGKKMTGKMSKSERKKRLIVDFRNQIKDKQSYGNTRNNKKSADWFNDIIKKSIRGHKVTKPVVGSIYAYAYDAKYKDTLPYWDMYPLIIYLGEHTSKAGNKLLIGLNLHYIPPKARQEFLEELLVYANTDTITNKTLLKINWNRVKSMRGADQMIKSYLPNHIKGAITEIKPHDWINVIYMPTQRFVSKGTGYSATKVWGKI